MQERQHLRPPGTYNSSCCLCVPRALYLSPDGTTLMQEPLPELQALRQPGSAWHIGSAAASGAAPVLLPPGQPLRLGAGSAAFCSSSSIDVELQLAKGDAQSVALLLHPFDGVAGAAGAAITYCWDTNTLQVRSLHASDATSHGSSTCCPQFVQGAGPLRMPAEYWHHH
jgi:hypothetical protein